MSFNYVNSYIDCEYKEVYRSNCRKFNIIIFACIKFMFDRVLALIGLIILSPLILIIAIAIKLDSKGGALYKQARTGKGGKNIIIYKFRTMVSDNDVYDYSKEDEYTRIGKFLRKTSLDEIPQLFSILKGDMSFIGPRPWVHSYFDNMNEYQRYRCSVRPGLTGLAQIHGRNSINIFDKIKYDLEYIENYSLRQDIKIFFITVKKVLKAEHIGGGKNGIQKDILDLQNANNIVYEGKRNE